MVFLPPALEEESLPADLFSVLFKCEGYNSPWRALLAHAVALQRPLLAILAACYEVYVKSLSLSLSCGRRGVEVYSSNGIFIERTILKRCGYTGNLQLCLCFIMKHLNLVLLLIVRLPMKRSGDIVAFAGRYTHTGSLSVFPIFALEQC